MVVEDGKREKIMRKVWEFHLKFKLKTFEGGCGEIVYNNTGMTNEFPHRKQSRAKVSY